MASGEGGTHVLHGMAGCGKTALARYVFAEVVDNGDAVGFWIDASSAASLRSYMIGVAADRGATPDELEAAHSGRRPAADLAWEYLSRSTERWLLVFDNADEPRLLQEGGWLRHSTRGTVLVTTRDTTSPVWHGTQCHPVGVLPLAAAAQVLLDLAPDAGEPQDFERLAQRLDRHPLALLLAGNHLRRQLLERWTVNDYIERLPEDPSELLDQGSDATESHTRTRFSSTWQLSLDALARQDLPEALTLLRLLSCFAPMPAPLPLSLLTPARLDATRLSQLDPPLTGARADRALQGLISTSLVSLLDAPGDRGRRPVLSLQTHGLLLDTVAARVPDTDHAPLLHSAIALLDTALSDAPDDQDLRLFTPHATALLRRAAAGDPRIAAGPLKLVRRLRALQYERGQFTAALELAEAAARFTTESLGAEHPDSIDGAYEAARAHTGTGRFTTAEELLRQVVAARERLLGIDDPRTLDSAHALGLALYGLGRWAEDEQVLRHTLSGREHILGTDHPDTLDTLGRLAEAVGEQGRWEEAESLARTTLERCESVLGVGHQKTVLSRIAHAWAVAGNEQWERAEPLASRTVMDSAAAFGSHHPRTLAAQHLHATVLARLGRWDEAEAALRDVIAARGKMLGTEHSHTLSASTDLAALLTASGRAREAVAVAAAAYDGYVRTLGSGHPRAARCHTVLREAHVALGAASTTPPGEESP
ncbi:tetratricopeptide repeat protein [Streptomyces sp. NPDC001339]|uniref:tetratricopeptide repeat protein n=1 Tax=Streptomyces sp. NPDC001339 TaxID=3364563 RepID=UPI0036736DA4